jgi:outer membrane murein-binding lipoprotein Lpp
MSREKLTIAQSPNAPPVISTRVQVAVATNPRLNHWELLFRVVIFLVLIASLALAWLTFTKVFVPAQRQSRELSAKFAALSSDVDQLERKWGPAEADEIRRSYREVYGQLFADQSALEAWLANLQAQAGPLGLEAVVDFGQSSPAATNEQKLAVVSASVSLEVRPVPGRVESPYQRLLQFTRQLAAEGKRADLAEMTVVGGTTSIPQATLVFSLWAGEEGKP